MGQPHPTTSGPVDPPDGPEPARKPANRRLNVALAVLALLTLTICQLAPKATSSFFNLVLPLVEGLGWLVAGAVIVRAVQVTIGRRVVSAAVAVCLLVSAVWFTNWAIYDPRSYFVIHRPAFDAIADDIRHGTLGSSDDYLGELLPVHLRDLSRDGRVAVVGREDGKPLVLVPQWFGVPDGAAGYLFHDGSVASDTVVDLYGDQARVTAGSWLGGGWWYVRGGVG